VSIGQCLAAATVIPYVTYAVAVEYFWHACHHAKKSANSIKARKFKVAFLFLHRKRQI